MKVAATLPNLQASHMNVVLCSGFTDDQRALAMRQHRVDVARLRETVGELLAANHLVKSVGESHVP